MFSEMLQGLLNSSGQAKAMQRYTQMNNYVNGLNGQVAQQKNNVNNLPSKDSIQSFDNVLKSTAQSQFGMLIKNKAAEKVNASLFTSKIPSNINITKRASKSEIIGIINEVSNKYDVDPKLIEALVKQESGFNPNAKSKAGALGLMQLMPSTAQGLGVKNAFDAEQNIYGGTKYLKGLMDRFGNNKELALAAYNAGPNAVKKYNGVPPYKETQNYVKNVMASYGRFKDAS